MYNFIIFLSIIDFLSVPKDNTDSTAIQVSKHIACPAYPVQNEKTTFVVQCSSREQNIEPKSKKHQSKLPNAIPSITVSPRLSEVQNPYTSAPR